jgi:hypothetical protein
MNSGSYTERLRNRTLFFASQLNTTQPKKFESPSILLETTTGGFPSYLNYKAMDVDFLPMPLTPSTPERPYTLDDAILLALQGLLQYAASSNLGPTRSSRLFYLWFFSLAAGYNWISPSTNISGTKDTWNWDTKYVILDTQRQFIWTNHLLIELMLSFAPGYDVGPLLTNESNALNMSSSQIDELLADIRSRANWSLWKSNWDTWRAYRQSDGNVAAGVAPTNAELPNGAQTIEVTTTTDDPSTFSEPAKWTPLKINGSKKNYLTYRWNDVLSSSLTSAQETSIKAAAQVYFPGAATSWNDGSTKANELNALVQLTNALTDEQKMTAEFWAGGPFTVSPPGMMIWIWANYMECAQIAHTRDFPTFLYSGFDLAIHLFEVGRLVWGLKKDNMEARPIQYIRNLYRTQTLTKYDGTSYLGASWIPFQATNFVTPPFADFPSGHSAFSQSFANVMNVWFSGSIESIQMTLKTLNLLSPTFIGWQTRPFGSFQIGKGSSEIQPTVVPNTTITLSWPTWQSMADSSGISRQYGGIHCASAHSGSVALANEMHTVLKNAWKII